MAGVRKLQELSARRSQQKAAGSFEDDTSPDKQLKGVTSASAGTAKRCANVLASSEALLQQRTKQKQVIKGRSEAIVTPLNDAFGRENSSNSNTRNGVSYSIKKAAQAPQSPAALLQPSTARSLSIPSKESSSSTVSVDNHALLAAAVQQQARSPAGMQQPAAAAAEVAAGGSVALHGNQRCAADGLQHCYNHKPTGRVANQQAQGHSRAEADALPGDFVQLLQSTELVAAAADAAAAMVAGAAVVQQEHRRQHSGQQHQQSRQQAQWEPGIKQQHQQVQQHHLQQVQSQGSSAAAAAQSAIDAFSMCPSAEDLLESLSENELIEVSRDVAARIIQAHWRDWLKRKHQQATANHLLEQLLQQQQHMGAPDHTSAFWQVQGLEQQQQQQQQDQQLETQQHAEQQQMQQSGVCMSEASTAAGLRHSSAEPGSNSSRQHKRGADALERLRRSIDGRQVERLQHRAGDTATAAVDPLVVQAEAAGTPLVAQLDNAQQAASSHQQTHNAHSAATNEQQAREASGPKDTALCSEAAGQFAAGHAANRPGCNATAAALEATAPAGGRAGSGLQLLASELKGIAPEVSSTFASHMAAAAFAAVDTAAVSRAATAKEKLGTILDYLDAVDAAADEEAAGLVAGPSSISRQPSRAYHSLRSDAGISRTSTSSRQHSRPSSAATAATATADNAAGHPTQLPQFISQRLEVQQLAAQSFYPPGGLSDSYNSYNHVQPVAGSPQHQQLQQHLQQPQQLRQQQPNLYNSHWQQQTHAQQSLAFWHTSQELHHSEDGQLTAEPSLCTTSVGGLSMASQSNRSAVLAENVFDGVRSKMNRLRATVAQKEGAIHELQEELQNSRQRHADQLAQLAQAHEQEIAAAAADAAAAVSRHLAFIDRLMADKESLNKQAADAQAALKAAEERHAAAITALKAGWAAELKRQQAAWEAGQSAKQEAWKTAQTAQIKEQTVKGLEVEVQRLISRHQTELAAALDRAAEQTKVAVGQARADYEAQTKALKERLRQEHAEALEREHTAAAAHLRDARERCEAQAQAARMRLLAEMDSKLEEAAATTREERRKAQAALEAAEAAAKQKEAQLKDEFAREKASIDRSHARAVESLKTAAQEERSAWRAAITEKLKKQALDREAQLRAALTKERDDEIDAIIQRLEAEQGAMQQAARDKVAAEHAAAIAALEERLREAEQGAARLANRVKAAGQAEAAADRQRDGLADQLEQNRQELQQLKQHLSAAQAALVAKEAEGRAAAAAAGTAATEALKALASDKGHLEIQLTSLKQQLQQLQQQHEAEMVHVEARVKGVIARKDEAIMRLQQQLAAAIEQLRATETVLAAQQAELCD